MTQFIGHAADFRGVPGMGDAACQHPRPQRLQVRRHECLQRGPHVHHGRRHLLRPLRQARRLLRHGLHFHHLLHHHYSLPCFCAKGKTVYKVFHTVYLFFRFVNHYL